MKKLLLILLATLCLSGCHSLSPKEIDRQIELCLEKDTGIIITPLKNGEIHKIRCEPITNN